LGNGASTERDQDESSQELGESLLELERKNRDTTDASISRSNTPSRTQDRIHCRVDAVPCGEPWTICS
jgi:hypothetical protein